MEIQKLLRNYLDQKHMMQLATVSGDQPWVCTVYYVYDDELNLYWASLPSRRHSQEIASHSKVAAAIPVKHVKGEKVIGIQVQGDAAIIELSDAIKPIAEKYAQKFGRDDKWLKEFANLETDHRLYKLTPELFVLFDEVNFPHNTRVEWKSS